LARGFHTFACVKDDQSQWREDKDDQSEDRSKDLHGMHKLGGKLLILYRRCREVVPGDKEKYLPDHSEDATHEPTPAEK